MVWSLLRIVTRDFLVRGVYYYMLMNSTRLLFNLFFKDNLTSQTEKYMNGSVRAPTDLVEDRFNITPRLSETCPFFRELRNTLHPLSVLFMMLDGV